MLERERDAYATGLDRQDVVTRLLALTPDLSIHEPIYDATARSIAEYQGYREIVTLIDQMSKPA